MMRCCRCHYDADLPIAGCHIDYAAEHVFLAAITMFAMLAATLITMPGQRHAAATRR